MSDVEIVKDFLVESFENLDRLDQDLIALEKDPRNQQLLASIFRTIHTIKGSSGFLGLHQLELVTHAGESLLERLRDGVLTMTPEIATGLLAMGDAVRQMLNQIESTGKEGQRDDRELIATLTRLQEHPSEATTISAAAGSIDKSLVSSRPEETLPATAPAQLSDPSSFESQSPRSALDGAGAPSEEPSGKLQPVSEPQQVPTEPRGSVVSDSTIRVDVSLLDQLMNLVGELVLTRNQILQFTTVVEESAVHGASQRLNLITTELQEAVMKTRMQPIGNIWSSFPRMVRDISLGCGKQILIEMDGKDTELDKKIIEAIKDPLTHLVRNAVDHGIESPEIRREAGKSGQGRLSLRAFHEGGQVNIEITDDGQGLDLAKVRNTAIQKGLVSADVAGRMTEREITNLIFLPGLSTADKVTNVSGRGVGMDVVKTNIEKIGGTVDIQTKPHHGTTVRMKIPLTLAIIPALIVTSAGDRYAIPQVSLLELVHLEGEGTGKGIEMIQGAPVHRLRGKLLPIVYLNRELKVGGNADPHRGSCARTSDGDVNIVILQADDRQFGLVVDEVNDTEEIVVKPLSKQLKSVNAYAGATIMGDGKVALILDVMGMAQRANVINEGRERSVADKSPRESGLPSEIVSRNPVVLFQSGATGRMAIDLSLVARLEEFPASSIEVAAGQEVVQYRGQIMPLLRVSDLLAPPRNPGAGGEESIQVIVYTTSAASVGLVVDRILDIVDAPLEVQRHTRRKGVLGSVVIQKHVTDILDVPGLVATAVPMAG